MKEDSGLSIERLDISTTGDADRFSYTLVLTQAADRDEWVEGSLTVEVIGQQGNDQRSLSLADLSKEGDYPVRFGLLYFEDVSGQMTLPPGYVPESVRVVRGARHGTALRKGIRLVCRIVSKNCMVRAVSE